MATGLTVAQCTYRSPVRTMLRGRQEKEKERVQSLTCG